MKIIIQPQQNRTWIIKKYVHNCILDIFHSHKLTVRCIWTLYG